MSEMTNRHMTLKEARDLAGLTQRQLAELSGLKVTSISDVEIGRIQRPSHEFVVRVIRALQQHGLKGITAEQIFPVPESSRVA